MKDVHPSSPTRRKVGGNDHLYLKFWAETQIRRFSIDIRS